MNLLIVDDEVITIKGMMEGIDWKAVGIDGSIWTAHSVEHALQILNAQQVDLILCDIEMPGANGIDLLRSIRSQNQEIACIFLTCHAKFEYAQEAIQLGCKGYILKPAPYEVISEQVKKTCDELRQKKRSRELEKYQLKEPERATEGIEKRESRTGKEIVQQVEEYIHQHLSDSELMVSDIASYLFLNKDYLNRVFKKEHNISISQYLIQERMKLAAILLENPENPVNDVAEQTGYNNYAYFASSFKRYHGCSPSQYRKNDIGI